MSNESEISVVPKETENSPNISPKYDVLNNYAVYLYSNKKHGSSSETSSTSSEKEYSLKNDVKRNYEETSICLSLLGGSLNAEQETVVRCYLLKILSSKEDLPFENEGKFTNLKFSNEKTEEFGCYYHQLSKYFDTESGDGNLLSKTHTFFICLIGPASGVMELFCSEFGVFCDTLVPLLDPQGFQQIDAIHLKLSSWYCYCVEYIERCVQNFKEKLWLVLLASLWGSVEIVSSNENRKWDIERFIDACCLLPSNIDRISGTDVLGEIKLPLQLKVTDSNIEFQPDLDISPYCAKWAEKITSCPSNDHAALRAALDAFKLKTTQDLNTLRRLLKKAQADHYALYKAFLFLRGSGYEAILLHHVTRESLGEKETLDIIACLKDFLKEMDLKRNQRSHR